MRHLSLVFLFLVAPFIPAAEASIYCAGAPTHSAPLPAAKLARSDREGTRYAAVLFARFSLEILRQADADIDFARFDNDGPDGLPNSGDDDGYVDALFIVLQAAPARFLIGNATGVGHLGLDEQFHTDDLAISGQNMRIRSTSGTIQQGRTFSEAVGVMCHEYGHVLGLPDLFDTDFLQSKEPLGPEQDSAGIGRWGLMGWGALGWLGNDGPTSFSAWSRLRLGWADVRIIDGAGPMPGLEEVGQRGLIYQMPLTAREYFLLEHRTSTSTYYDRHIPGEGLLVWHVENILPRGDFPFQTRVDLECADGLYRDAGYPLGAEPDAQRGGDNLDFWAHDSAYATAYNGNLGDATDVFDGLRFTSFTPDTNPASLSSDGVRSMRLEQIRRIDGQIFANVEGAPLLVSFTNLRYDDSNDNVLVAGEEARLLFRVGNGGGTDIEEVRVLLTSDDEYVEVVQAETNFGSVRAGARSSGAGAEGFPRFRLKGGFTGLHRAVLRVSVFVGEELVAREELVVTAISPVGLVQNMAVSDSLGNGDGQLQRGEFFRLSLELDLDSAEHLWAFQFSLRPLDKRIRPMESATVLFALENGLVRSVQSPEFLLATDVTAGELLAFAMEARNGTRAWLDTLYVQVAAGADHSPPRVGAPRVRRMGMDRLVVLSATQITEGGTVAATEVEVYTATDTARVQTVPLKSVEDRFAGTWRTPEAGAYLLRALAEDASGNRGYSDFAPHTVLDNAQVPEQTQGIWQQVELPTLRQLPSVSSLAIAPSDSRILYLSGQEGLWRSVDRGLSWTPLDVMQKVQLLVDASDANTIYTISPASKSTDGGQSWARLPDVFVRIFLASAQVSGRLYGTRDGEVVLSEDGGQSWRETGVRGFWAAEHPLRPEIIYAGTSFVWEDGQFLPGVLYRSSDHGRSWNEQRQTFAWTHVEPDPRLPQGLYALENRALYHSADAGASWEMRYEFPGKDNDHFSLLLNAVAPDLMYVKRQSGQGYRSRDGGRTWKVLRLPAARPGLLQDPQVPQRLYMWSSAVGTGIAPLQRSEDSGESWAGLQTPTAPNPAGVIAFDAGGDVWVGGRAYADGTWRPRLFYSSDGGYDWSVRGDNSTYGSISPVDNLLIDPFDARRLVAQTNSFWSFSFDGGLNWRPLGYRPGFAFAYHVPLIASPLQRGTYYIGGRSLFRSEDGPLSWQE